MTDPTEVQPGQCPSCGHPLQVFGSAVFCPTCVQREATGDGDSGMDLTRSMELSFTSSIDPVMQSNATRELLAGDRFGDYQIHGELGRGGMGVVYEADHLPTSRRVALKVMGHSWDDSAARSRFLREGSLAASINHPNSVYVYGTEEIQDRPAISMELVAGRTLSEVVKADGPMTAKAAVDAILQVIDGLEAAAAMGVLHRDVKPNNCFSDHEGRVKVGDFGLSISTHGRKRNADGSDADKTGLSQTTHVTRQGMFLGTPAYASPEQLRSEPLDQRSDIYALGVTLYFLVCGRVPFDGDNMVQLLARVLDSQPQPLQNHVAGVSGDLQAVIFRCLAKSADARFQTYSDLRKALLPHSSRELVPAMPAMRFFAYLIDLVLYYSVTLASVRVGASISGDRTSIGDDLGDSVGLLSQALAFSYFFLSEWRFGRTLGKYLLGLRVTADSHRPTLVQAAVRVATFEVLPMLPALMKSVAGDDVTLPLFLGLFTVYPICPWAFTLLLFATMRARNGYLAFHERISGTRTVQEGEIPSFVRGGIADQELPTTTSSGPKVGAFQLLEKLFDTADGTVWMAFDQKLRRRAWVHLREVQVKDAGSKQPNKLQKIAGPCRLKWLGHGTQKIQGDLVYWDAFEAIDGMPLSEIDRLDLPWSAVKSKLKELASAIDTAVTDRALPRLATSENIWVNQFGEFKLLPFAMPMASRLDVRTGSLDGDTPPPGLQLIQSICHQLQHHFSPIASRRQQTSFREQNLLTKIKTADSLDSVNQYVVELFSVSDPGLGPRVAVVAIISCAPLFVAIVSVMTLAATQTFHSLAGPTMEEFGAAIQVMTLEKNKSEDQSPNDIQAVRTYIGGNFESLYEAEKEKNSDFFRKQAKPAEHEIEAIFREPKPSKGALAKATVDYERLKERNDVETGDLADLEQVPFLFAILNFCWLSFVVLPSSVTGLLFRRGLLFKLLNLRLINQQGHSASRFRVVVRMVLSGVFATLHVLCWIAILYKDSVIDNSPSEVYLLTLVCLLTFVSPLWVLVTKNQFLSDCFAGTKLAVD